MKSSIYEFKDYKKFLLELIKSSESKGRGKRLELAKYIGCQVSHITNVFTGSAHFSQEQAEAASRFFGLSQTETEFLLLLVQYNRAGTQSLKKLYERWILERQEKLTALKSRLKMPDSLEGEAEARYYSSWHYGAIHVLLSIHEFQTREAITKKLGLPLSKVDEVLLFLIESGLCKKEGLKYSIVRPLIHLDKNSPLISKHHTNWRLRTIMALDEFNTNNLHYSSVFTLSKKDYERVKEILSKSLSESLKLITESPEEELGVLCLDLIKL